jgi:catalase
MKKLTTAFGAPVVDNQNITTAGPNGPALLQDVWFLEKLANFDREVIPERWMHAKGSGAAGTFTVTHDITKYTRAKIFSAIGKKTGMFARFSIGCIALRSVCFTDEQLDGCLHQSLRKVSGIPRRLSTPGSTHVRHPLAN